MTSAKTVSKYTHILGSWGFVWGDTDQPSTVVVAVAMVTVAPTMAGFGLLARPGQRRLGRGDGWPGGAAEMHLRVCTQPCLGRWEPTCLEDSVEEGGPGDTLCDRVPPRPTHPEPLQPLYPLSSLIALKCTCLGDLAGGAGGHVTAPGPWLGAAWARGKTTVNPAQESHGTSPRRQAPQQAHPRATHDPAHSHPQEALSTRSSLCRAKTSAAEPPCVLLYVHVQKS